MRTQKAILAGSLAAALALTGGVWSSGLASAASNTNSTDQQQTQQQELRQKRGQAIGERGTGKRLVPFKEIQSNLLEYLNLDGAALREKLEQSTLAEVAESQGIARAELKAQILKWLESSEAANEDAADLSAKVDQWLDSNHAAAGKDGFAGPRGHGFGHGGIFGSHEALTEVLGLSEDGLKEAIQSATSLADLASKQGVDVNQVIDALVNAETEHLKEQLSAGKITQDKYDARIAELRDAVTKQVNGEFPAKPERKTQN
ncbi:hypothetical protein YSY43_44030 [Paenibacillus sp. YSY-4.3]